MSFPQRGKTSTQDLDARPGRKTQANQLRRRPMRVTQEESDSFVLGNL